jgi:hypothetical protein
MIIVLSNKKTEGTHGYAKVKTGGFTKVRTGEYTKVFFFFLLFSKFVGLL